MADTDARLWRPWLRINRMMMTTEGRLCHSRPWL